MTAQKPEARSQELETDPICAPVVAAIAEAEDAHQLLHIFSAKIPRLKGITDEQRRELVRLLDVRFSTLNGQVVNQKPRWAPHGNQINLGGRS